MSPDLDYVFWLAARAFGLASFAALCLSILSGVALRTSVLDILATNRAMRALHDFTTPLWLPLGGAHAVLLVLDHTARIAPLDLVVPFQVTYGTVAIGLGTVSLDLLLVVVVTSWFRRAFDQTLWRWLHRLAYPAFVALFLHALFSGTDFGTPIVSALAWSTAAALGVLVVSRLLWGRLPA